MGIKHKIRKLFWKAGYDLYKITLAGHPIARRKRIFETCRIDTVIDIGANTGFFAQELRNYVGYTNRILSFEPLSTAFELLKTNAKNDPDWAVFNYALGDTEKTLEINIARNSFSSSFLDMLPSHIQSAPESRYIGRDLTEIKTLDSVFGDWCNPNNNVYMKIDTQGFESRIIKGAEKSLSQIDIVQMEMSLVPLYKGELLFPDMCMLMAEKGFRLIGIETVFSDQVTGRVLQVDGTFQAEK